MRCEICQENFHSYETICESCDNVQLNLSKEDYIHMRKQLNKAEEVLQEYSETDDPEQALEYFREKNNG